MTDNIPLIRHPGAALIVPFFDERNVIILRQFRPAIGKYLYELPAGTLEAGESPAACARRELQEEAGYKAGRISRLGCIYPVPGYSTEKIFIYKACRLIPASRSPEKDEVIRVEKASRGRVVALFRSGKINDAKTICAFAFCGWL
ncbi:MAG: NUDIX hydrolase [Candidatus Omnitrophica bacterium]|nr:NUDIX hydrolase [Candidatus Omnitrophota bacterium]MDD5042433.1 NUDIX hydrolase [Candidatus Omnitrophota bacterium]MDD5500803.1 NUDIX hydrolase [Candidatus Omnitrophota bacterium]